MSTFSDDELDEFYRSVEARTASNARPARSPAAPDPALGCPTPTKDAYRSRVDAEDAIAYARATRRTDTPLRTYRCVCGRWHITSSPEMIPTTPKPSRRGRRRKR